MLKIQLNSPVPLVTQIYRGIRRALATGELDPGDALPTVRQLAGDLSISLNTVSRAYQMLEGEGLIATVRGRGTVVVAKRETPRRAKRAALDRLREEVRNLLANASLAGLSWKETREILIKESPVYWEKL